MRHVIHLSFTAGALLLGLSNLATSDEQSFDELLSMDLAGLLEINVSSSRAPESYRNIPQAVSLVNSTQISQYQLTDLYDLAFIVPNFSFRRSFGRWQERPSMRGVTAIVGEPTTGLLIDGMSAEDMSTILPLFDLEQVEVLRGPEAAMFGRSTFNGAVNLVNKKPTPSFDTQASLAASSYNGRSLTFHTNAGNDSAAVRLSSSLQERGNYVNNELGEGGNGYGKQQTHYVKLAATWQVTNELELYSYFSKVDAEDGMLPVYLQNASSNNCYLESNSQYYCGKVHTPEAFGFNNLSDWDFELNKHVSRAHIALNYKQEGFDIRLVHASSDADLHASYDADFYELNAFFNLSKEEKQSESTEIFSNFYFDHHRVLLGLSHFKYDQVSVNQSALAQAEDLAILPALREDSIIENYAAFSSVDLQLSSDIRLLIDARYSQDKVAFEAAENSAGNAQWKGLQPRLSVSKTWNQDWLSYFSTAKGIKPGGFNAALANLDVIDEQERQRVNTAIFYDQEDLINIEVGLRGEALSDRLFIRSALYAFEWDNLQLSQSLEYTNSDNDLVRARILDNGGFARGQGLELELDAKITSNFNTQFNYGYAQTKLNNTDTAAQESLTGAGSVDGNDIPVAPQHTASLGATYSSSLGRWQWRLSGLTRYESKRWVAEHNLAYAPETLQFDMRLSATKGPFEFYFWGKNINGDDSAESVARFGDAATFFVRRGFAISMTEPRTLGVGISLSL